MYATLQQNLFENEQGGRTQRCYQGGSRANRTALRESVWHLVMSVICGENSQGAFAFLNRAGCWVKMYGGYFQAKMDGSSDEFCETWPNWGIRQGGLAFLPHGLEPSIDESAFSLLPTPIASDSVGSRDTRPTNPNGRIVMKSGTLVGRKLRRILCDIFNVQRPHPQIYETIMGFPVGWTELEL